MREQSEERARGGYWLVQLVDFDATTTTAAPTRRGTSALVVPPRRAAGRRIGLCRSPRDRFRRCVRLAGLA